MPRPDPEQRAAAIARLVELREAGALTSQHVRTVAAGLSTSDRTVWRWLERASAGAAMRRPGPAPYRLSEADREALAFYTGNIAAVFRARRAVLAGQDTAAGVPVPQFLRQGWSGAPAISLRTLQEAYRTQLTPAELAMWRTGEEGRRAAGVYLRRPDAVRNQCWEMDHKQLPIVVLPPRGPALSPWLTTVVDDGTRALVGWAIAVTPHAGTVLTALRMALTADAERGPFGGIPAGVRVDRGLEFAARPVREVLDSLAVLPHRLPGFMPHRKGKVERIHLTIEQTMLCALPGFTKGPRDASGVLYGPVSDRARDRAAAEHADVGPMRIERFVAQFVAWERWYNHERPHDALDGRTPVQAWAEDTAPVRPVPADRLRHLLLASDDRTIGKLGVRFNNFYYIAPELDGRGGQTVQVRYMPHDDRQIEVYRDGMWLCTAYPQGRLSEQQEADQREHARAESRRLAADRRRAAKRARVELAPMTDGQPAQQSRLTPPGQAAAASGRRADNALRRHTSTSLLGLGPVGPIDEPQNLDAITQAAPAPVDLLSSRPAPAAPVDLLALRPAPADDDGPADLLGLRPARAVDDTPRPDEAAMRANSSTSLLGLKPTHALPPPDRTD